jgi:hypothetical protein
MVKICQTGSLKLALKLFQKNAFFGFCQKFSYAIDEQNMDEVKNLFFANRTKEGAHSPEGVGVGGPNSGDWKKSSALCLFSLV